MDVEVEVKNKAVQKKNKNTLGHLMEGTRVYNSNLSFGIWLCLFCWFFLLHSIIGKQTPSVSSCECVYQHVQTLTPVLLITIVNEQTYF